MCIICDNDINDNKEINVNHCDQLSYNIFIKCDNINKISNLAINNCKNLNMIPVLDRLYSLFITNCENIKFIMTNTKLKKLTIINCNNLEQILFAETINKLTVIDCPKYNNLIELANLKI